MAPHPIRVLELCAGYGGISLGLRISGVPTRTVCMVEREAHVAALLVAQMAAGLLDPCPVWDDLCQFDARPWRGAVDLVTAGFPCQPFSVAGKRLGEADERWIWPDIARIVAECRPALVFLENVELTAFRRPRSDLADLGFRVLPALRVAASDVGAPHERDRWWVLAVADAEVTRPSLGTWAERRQSERPGPECSGSEWATADADHQRQLQPEGPERAQWGWAPDRGWWTTEPGVCGSDDDAPHRLDRLRMLGNGVVPLAAAVAFDVLLAEALK